MTSATATVTRWSRAFVVVSALCLVGWQLAVVLDLGRRVSVVLGLYGFVFCTIFGKGYSLLPSYFDRKLAVPRAPAVHLPLALAGIGGLAAAAIGIGPDGVGTAGALSWTAGVLVFVGTLGWTIRDNLTGRETGTSEANADRRTVDRLANGFVPIVLAYLVAGALLTVTDGGPTVTHLLAAGAGTLLVFAVGFRLLPRFLVVTPRTALVAVVLPAGALGPALLVSDFLGGLWFRVGALLQALAVIGFAVAYAEMYVRSDRSRVGLHAVLTAAVSGVAGVSIAVQFAFVGVDPTLVTAHLRLLLLGFLGLTVVGVSYQFYPPAIGSAPGAGDRGAMLSIGCLFGGLVVEVGGALGAVPELVTAGRLLALTGTLLYAYVLFSTFYERHRRSSGT